MATSKEYAYYIKGNKVAIVEKDWALSGGQTLSQPGLNDLGSTDGSLWKSPKASITDGLEIQYTYSPAFGNSVTGNVGTYHHKFLGWGRTSLGNLAIFTHSYGTDATIDLQPLFTVGDYVEIKNSQKWNGFHKIKQLKVSGWMILETKADITDMYPASLYGTYNFVAAAGGNRGYLTGPDATTIANIQEYKNATESTLNPIVANRTAPHYIFIEGGDTASNDGVWEVSFPTTNGQIQFEKKITMDANGVTSSATEAIATESSDLVSIIQIFYEETDVFGSDEGVYIQPMDESFELDLPRYQANAVVQYVKSRYLEDAGNVEMKEYYMREFRRMVEKHESGKKRGVYVTQGFGLFR